MMFIMVDIIRKSKLSLKMFIFAANWTKVWPSNQFLLKNTLTAIKLGKKSHALYQRYDKEARMLYPVYLFHNFTKCT